MRITRLEIFGFKSFVERFVLNFDKDIIGIVGPNGCGKSNIVDSLRWVLGETHARQLRGGSLEDLIFNGSESRRPLGMAEVSITIQPNRAWSENLANQIIPVEKSADPVQLVSDKEQGESHLEADADSSEGAVAESEEGQQSKQALQSPTPEDIVPQSLQNIPGLFDAAEIQLTRRLYRSGESEYFINRIPCRLRDMTEIYRLIGLGSRGLNIVQQGQIGEFISKKPSERRALLEEAAGISGFRARMEAAQRKLDRTSENMDRLSDIILEVEKQVRSLKRQANRARNRNELKASLSEAEHRLFELRTTQIILRKQVLLTDSGELEHFLNEKRGKLQGLEAQQLESRSKLGTIDVALVDLRRKRDELFELLNTEREREHELRVELARLEGKERAVEDENSRIVERAFTLDVELEQTKAALASKQELLDATQADAQRLEETQHSLEEHAAKLSQVELRLRTSQTEQRALQEQLDAQLDAGELEEFVGSEGKAKLLDKLGMVLDYSPEIEIAVLAVLGDFAKHYLCLDVDGFVAEYQKRESVGRKQFGVIDASAGFFPSQRSWSEEERALAPSAVSFHDRLDVTDERFDSALKSVVADVYLVDTLDEALAVNNFHKASGRDGRSFVTRQGELVRPWGWSVPCSNDFAVSARTRVRELDSEISELEQSRDQLSREHEDVQRLQEAASRLLVSSLSIELADSSVSDTRRSVQEVLFKVAEYKNALQFDASRVKRLSDEKLTLERELTQLENAKSECADQKSALLAKLAGEESSSREEETRGAEHDFSSLEKEISERESERGDAQSELGLVADEVSSLRRELEELGAQENTARMATEKSDLELAMLLEDFQRYYGDESALPTEEKAKELSAEIEGDFENIVRELQTEASGYRKKLEREGDVDPQSIELYETENKRLEEMREQRADLEEARKTLETTIRQLKQISRERFLETFKDVSKTFTELVPRLFGGGSGNLELINPDDPLTSGVELSVRPPGKKITTMELMSGGEKALVATAVMMAMFLHRPGPICVLDEVDAPLDDANLERFMSLIKEISDRTQFLIITHSKLTMGAVDRLLGITMQERGVSKALTVSLAEAERELEQWVANQ